MILRILVGLLLAGLPSWACSCASSRSPCEAVGQASAVFSGRVLSVEEPSEFPPIGGRFSNRATSQRITFPVRTVHFQVQDVLSGIEAGKTEVEIVTGRGGGDCGYAFQAGVEYVVYASRDSQGRLATGICSRTAPVTAADEDLAYFRQVASAPVTSELRVRTGSYETPGKPGVAIRAEGPGGRYQGLTNDAGEALFPHVQPGEYTIHLEADGPRPNDPKINVYPKGCVSVGFYRRPE